MLEFCLKLQNIILYGYLTILIILATLDAALYLLQVPCVAPEKVLIIDCKFVASRVFNLIVFKKFGLIV